MDYSRLDAIHWWDRRKIGASTVLIAGVGAVGNEVAKLSALVGTGKILLVDFDSIEDSNLTRSVLFSARDVGQKKADVAAKKIRDLNGEVRVAAFDRDIVWLGLGALSRMDLVYCCFDGYLPRFHLNHHLQFFGIPWIDGGMTAGQELNGQVTSYLPSPETACFECGRSRKAKSEYYDLEAQLNRWSCAKSERDAAAQGAVPSTPMMASIIAGLEVTEGLRYLVRHPGLPPRPGTRQAIQTGDPGYELYSLKRNPTCPQHAAAPITDLYELTSVNSSRTTVGELLNMLGQLVPGDAQIELFYDVVADAECPECRTITGIFEPLLVFARQDNPKRSCANCGTRLAAKGYGPLVNRQSPIQTMTLAEAGFRPADILKVYPADNPLDCLFAELTRDVAQVLDFK